MKRLLCLLALVLAGCKTTPGDVRLVAQAATFGTLYGVHADTPTATKVQTIARGVSESTAGGMVDWATLRAQVEQQIKESFPGTLGTFITALGNEVISRVMEALPPQPEPSLVLQYANAGAMGVDLGAGFYLEFLKPQPVAFSASGTKRRCLWWRPQ